jgi:acyl-CoA synthetase (AMP-forming)/AMP-acid ligase II
MAHRKIPKRVFPRAKEDAAVAKTAVGKVLRRELRTPG